MRAVALILALCLCAGATLAERDRGNDRSDGHDWLQCSNATGLAGGWQPLGDDELPTDLLQAINDDFVEKFAGNISAWLGGNEWTCGPDDTTISAAGCTQVVAGIKYKLLLNVTCEIGGSNYTIGLDLDAYSPPGGNETTIQIHDLDVDFIAVNGVITNDNVDDVDGDDRFQYDPTTGTIIDNDNWNDEDGDHDMGDGHDHDGDAGHDGDADGDADGDDNDK